MFKQEPGGMSGFAPQQESVSTPELKVKKLETKEAMLKELTACAERSKELLHELAVLDVNIEGLPQGVIEKMKAEYNKKIMEINKQAMELNSQISKAVEKL